MKYLPVIPILFLSLLLNSCSSREKDIDQLIEEQLSSAILQAKQMDADLPPDRLPRSFDAVKGELITSGPGWWCSGFYPGVLWYLYDYSADTALAEMAARRTAIIENEQYNRGTHDLGFMIYNSYGLGLEFAGIEDYRKVMVNGAYSLLSRFNKTVGCIKSWDHGSWDFPVIVDNMMNLEYLVWAFHETDDSTFLKASISHADHTIKNHYRDDFSSYHLVDYDTITGNVTGKQTDQGYADESAWARGQAWGLYGFVMMYRVTGEERYLEQAVGIADFITQHENLPADKIPYWDLNDPDIPNAKRDASAGAIICSALTELQAYVGGEKSIAYLQTAETILRTLSSPEYRSAPGENGNFLLMHSVGNFPDISEVDVPLTYSDYYFIEALLRMKNIAVN